jgi:hypothetical protein
MVALAPQLDPTPSGLIATLALLTLRDQRNLKAIGLDDQARWLLNPDRSILDYECGFEFRDFCCCTDLTTFLLKDRIGRGSEESTRDFLPF